VQSSFHSARCILALAPVKGGASTHICLTASDWVGRACAQRAEVPDIEGPDPCQARSNGRPRYQLAPDRACSTYESVISAAAGRLVAQPPLQIWRCHPCAHNQHTPSPPLFTPPPCYPTHHSHSHSLPATLPPATITTLWACGIRALNRQQQISSRPCSAPRPLGPVVAAARSQPNAAVPPTPTCCQQQQQQQRTNQQPRCRPLTWTR